MTLGWTIATVTLLVCGVIGLKLFWLLKWFKRQEAKEKATEDRNK